MRCLMKPITLFVVILVSVFYTASVIAPAYAIIPPPNNCVGIASDSNGDGHVTFQLPPAPDGQVGIIFVRPLEVVLREELDDLGLTQLTVIDRSLTATSLTASERTNYLKSDRYGSLIADRCKFNMVGPFIPDVRPNHIKFAAVRDKAAIAITFEVVGTFRGRQACCSQAAVNYGQLS